MEVMYSRLSLTDHSVRAESVWVEMKPMDSVALRAMKAVMLWVRCVSQSISVE